MNLRNMIRSEKSASQIRHMYVNSKDVKLNNTLFVKQTEIITFEGKQGHIN